MSTYKTVKRCDCYRQKQQQRVADPLVQFQGKEASSGTGPQECAIETRETTYPGSFTVFSSKSALYPAPHKGLLEMMSARFWEVHHKFLFLLTTGLSIPVVRTPTKTP